MKTSTILLLAAGAAAFYAYRRGYFAPAAPVLAVDPSTGVPIVDPNGDQIVLPPPAPTWGGVPRRGTVATPVSFTNGVSVWNQVGTPSGAAGGTPGGGTTRGSRNPAQLKGCFDGMGTYEVDNAAVRRADRMMQQAHFSRPGDRSGRARLVRRR